MKPVLATLCLAFLFSWCSCDQDHVSPDDFVPQVEVLQDNDASTILQNSDQRVIPIYQVFNVINQLVYLLNRVRYPDLRKLLHEHMKDNQATLSDQETQSKRETQNGQDTVLNFAVVPEKNADSGKEHVISGIGDGTDSLAGFSKAEVLKEFVLFDRDGNNQISAEELGAVMAAIGLKTEQQEQKTIISSFDIDNSGTIGKDEFYEVMMSRDVQHEKQMQRDVEETFRLMDTDGDKRIATPEMVSMMARLHLTATEQQVIGMLEEVKAKSPLNISDFTRLIIVLILHAAPKYSEGGHWAV